MGWDSRAVQALRRLQRKFSPLFVQKSLLLGFPWYQVIHGERLSSDHSQSLFIWRGHKNNSQDPESQYSNLRRFGQENQIVRIVYMKLGGGLTL